jgi:hypothetical protein
MNLKRNMNKYFALNSLSVTKSGSLVDQGNTICRITHDDINSPISNRGKLKFNKWKCHVFEHPSVPQK